MPPAVAPPELAETRILLTELAQRRFGRIKPERIAELVLAVTPGAELPVRRAALDALARRYGFAERDELRLGQRPTGSAVVGVYGSKSALKSRRAVARPYATELLSIDPLRTSCSCADFVRSSLARALRPA